MKLSYCLPALALFLLLVGCKTEPLPSQLPSPTVVTDVTTPSGPATISSFAIVAQPHPTSIVHSNTVPARVAEVPGASTQAISESVQLVDPLPTATFVSYPAPFPTPRVSTRHVYISELPEWQPRADFVGIRVETLAEGVTSPPRHQALPDDICPLYDVERWVDYRCAQRIEAFLLMQDDSTASRFDERLSITTADLAVTFVNQPGNSIWGVESYSYLGFLPTLGNHLVSVHYHEGGTFFLVDAGTGELTPIPTIPTINSDGSRFAFIYGPSEPPALQVDVWRVDYSDKPTLQPDRRVSVSYLGGEYGDTSALWIQKDRLVVNFDSAQHEVSDEVVVNIGAVDFEVTINGKLAVRPVISLRPDDGRSNPVRAVEELAVGKKLYYDRDYVFTTLSAGLDGQPYFLFGNGNLAERSSEYATIKLFRPARLYVAIDEQACELPGWMVGWAPSDERVVTTDIGMNVYEKDFPEGEVIVGGNGMPPAACIRSHYLLFVSKR